MDDQSIFKRQFIYNIILPSQHSCLLSRFIFNPGVQAMVNRDLDSFEYTKLYDTYSYGHTDTFA